MGNLGVENEASRKWCLFLIKGIKIIIIILINVMKLEERNYMKNT